MALGIQPRYKAPGDLWVEANLSQRLTWVNETVSLIMAQSWQWGGQTAHKRCCWFLAPENVML